MVLAATVRVTCSAYWLPYNVFLWLFRHDTIGVMVTEPWFCHRHGEILGALSAIHISFFAFHARYFVNHSSGAMDLRVTITAKCLVSCLPFNYFLGIQSHIFISNERSNETFPDAPYHQRYKEPLSLPACKGRSPRVFSLEFFSESCHG